MSERTPLRERAQKVKNHLPIVYSIEGLEENNVIKEVENFEKSLMHLDKHKLLTTLGISSGMSQDDIKEKISSLIDNVSVSNEVQNGDGIDEENDSW